MPTPDADPAATLEAIKERAKSAAAMDIDVLAAFSGVSVGGVIAASAVDVPVLVAALEAALDLADDWDAESDNLDDLAERPGADDEGAPIMSGQAIAYHNCAEALREAITREITGKGESDE